MTASAVTPRCSTAPIAWKLRGDSWTRFSKRGRALHLRRFPIIRRGVKGRALRTIWRRLTGGAGVHCNSLERNPNSFRLSIPEDWMILAGDIGGTKTNLGLFEERQGTL